MLIDNFRSVPETFRVESPNVEYNPDCISSTYDYQSTELSREQVDGVSSWIVKPISTRYEFKTSTKVPKLG